ncbi:MAG: DUF5700 domain-containing putative Zn-dependent protease [Candidatus Thorarchaeota archaeon]
MSLSVQIDTSFIVPLLQYLSKPSKGLLFEITKHEAAKKTHSHALKTRNTKKGIDSFWKHILNQLSKDESLIDNVKDSLTYIHKKTETFNELLMDLWNYFPEGTNLRSVLYTTLGYDIGIVSEGYALLNIGHPDFQKHPEEILFMSMHELHHVVYTAYNPFFDLSEIHRTNQLCDVIKYCTHMEGLAMYSILEQRKTAKALNNRDYKLFLDNRARKKRVSEYFDILTELEVRHDSPLDEVDWKILAKMSDRNRLWYVTGAHMAEIIDRNLGKETLIETIRLGPDDFFKAYHESF